MEYLMTYGWAILVISIVLASLWQLGVFNSAAQAPKAQPGACRVSRTQVFGSGVQVALEGSCGNLLPQFVAKFNGQSGNIIMNPNLLNGACSGTVFLWFDAYPWPSGNSYTTLLTKSNGAGWVNNHISIAQYASGSTIALTISNDLTSTQGHVQTPAISFGTWYQIAMTWNGAPSGVTLTGYLDGVNIGSNTATSQGTVIPCEPSDSSLFALGTGPPGSSSRNFNGLISDVQIYNTSLSASEVQALYDAGVGATPLPLPNLIGWWPLNGDTYDYSGNLNNGVPTSVVMNSSWTSGYIAP
jgi:hypothetical protein